MDFQTLFDRPDIDENKKLIDGPSTLTYGAFYTKCRQVHSFFSANGFVSGDRIGIATQDEIELCCLFLCCLRFG